MAMYRRTIREQLFKLLFRFDFLSGEEMKEQEELFFDSGDQTFTDADRAEIAGKLESILAHREEIDREIAERSEGWSLDRMGKVELTLLRLAVYEMKYDESVPEKIAINEAVELAKKYEDYIISMRRYFHENPELSDHEDATVERLSEELKKLDVEHVIVPHGGILATIKGKEWIMVSYLWHQTRDNSRWYVWWIRYNHIIAFILSH